jgi:serine/threonine protein kinase
MSGELYDGQTFGGYTILGQLGRGGMASVYRAYESKLEREVALKVLPAEVLSGADSAERFAREAKLVAMLEHPNIVPLYAYGIDGNRPWMALRLVRGSHLGDHITSSLSREAALGYLRAVAAGLDYAHSKGVVHRDLKPQNVLVGERGEVYLADFGIARLLEGATLLTQPGLMMGTPQYMAPEQAQADTVGPAADIYSLGIIAYQMLTGVLPFTADTPLAVATKHVCMPLPLEPLQSLPETARLVLVRALSKDPQDRWDRASTFVEKLARGLAVAPSARDAETTTASAMAKNRAEAADGKQPKRTSRISLLVLAIPVVLTVAIIGGWLMWPGFETNVQQPVADPSAVTQQPSSRPAEIEPESSARTTDVGDDDVGASRDQEPTSPQTASALTPAVSRPQVVPEATVSNDLPYAAERQSASAATDSVRPKPSPSAPAPQTAPATEVLPYRVADGVVSVVRDGLHWRARDNGRDIAFDDAVKHCGAAGAGWRLPVADELVSLFESPDASEVPCGARTCRSLPPIRLSGPWLWTSEEGARGTRITVGLDRGQQDQSRAEDRFGMRALCVRK